MGKKLGGRLVSMGFTHSLLVSILGARPCWNPARGRAAGLG